MYTIKIEEFESEKGLDWGEYASSVGNEIKEIFETMHKNGEWEAKRTNRYRTEKVYTLKSQISNKPDYTITIVNNKVINARARMTSYDYFFSVGSSRF